MNLLKPTKGKIILFIIILILGLLSNSLKVGCFGCTLTPTQQLINKIPKFTSPGINALLSDNGYFMNHKPYSTIGDLLEGGFHFAFDIIYWYLISCVIFFIFKRKS